MKTYIALLRGINVSGQKIIKMEILRTVLQELNLHNITTYIQSGNIIFKSLILDTKNLENQISGKIQAHFGFQVSVLIVSVDELKNIIKNNPFIEENKLDATQPYVAFLSEKPTVDKIEILKSLDFGDDKFINIEKALYLFYAKSAANTKLTNVVIENKLKIIATSRNWKTINKLIELVEQNY